MPTDRSRIHGCRGGVWSTVAVGWVVVAMAHAHAGVRVSSEGPQVEIGSDLWQIRFEPTGAACVTLQARGHEWLGRPLGGLEFHIVDQYTAGASDYGQARFTAHVLRQTPQEAALQLVALGRTGEYGFCEARKIVRLQEGVPAAWIRYEFYVGSGAVIPLTPAFIFVQSAPGDAEILVPREEGIVRFDLGADDPLKVPLARGWVAVRKGQVGLVYVIPFEDIQYLGVRGEGSALKWVWRTVPQQVEVESTRSWEVILIPYQGLDTIQGAGSLGCGEVVLQGDQGTVKFFAVDRGEAVLELAWREGEAEPWSAKAQQPVSLAVGLNTWRLPTRMMPHRQYHVRIARGDRIADLYCTVGDRRFPIPLQGERLKPVVTEKKWRDIDYSDFVPTPHVRWAKPLPGGPLRIFATWGYVTQNRMVNEIMQRVDATVDTVTMASGHAIGWGLGGPLYGSRTRRDIDEALKGYLAGEAAYDVIVLGGGLRYPDLGGDDIGAAILDRVRKGAGLVLAGVSELSELFKRAVPVLRAFGTGHERWSTKGDALHPLTAGLPIDRFSSPIIKYLGVKPEAELLAIAGVDGVGEQATENPAIVAAPYGKGRMVVLAGLPDGEMGYALLTRAILWAAGREPTLRIRTLSPSQESYAYGEAPTIRLEVEAPQGQISGCEVEWRCGAWKTERRLALLNGRAQDEVTLPAELSSGHHRVDVLIQRDGGHENFGLVVVDIRPPAELGLELPEASVLNGRPWFEHGTSIRGRCRPVDGFRLTVDLEDGLGRVLDRVAPAADGRFALSTRASERYEARVVARLWRNGRVAQEEGVPVWITLRPEHRIWDEMQMLLYGSLSGVRARVLKEAADPWTYGQGEDLRAICTVGVPYGIAHVDTGAWEALLRDYAQRKAEHLLYRVPCINAPEFAQMVQEICRRRASEWPARLGTLAYINGDEQSYTSYTREFDFCFHPACLHEFRHELRKKYGSLPRLNEVWGQAYRDWDEVRPPLTADVRNDSRLLPAWNDFRLFNNVTFAKGYAMILQELRRYDPSARLGISGTQQPAAFGGYDWSRLMKVFDVLQEYGGCDELQLAFNPRVRLAPAVGYSADAERGKAIAWRMFAMGGGGLSYYDATSGIYPTLKFAPGLQAMVEVLSEVRESGLSKALLTAEKLWDPVGCYYSHESINAAYMIFGGNPYAEANEWFRKVRGSSSFDPTWMDRERLLAGQPPVRVLACLSVYALGEEELRALQAFLERGGWLVADQKLGLTDLHLRRRTDLSAIEALRRHPRYMDVGSVSDARGISDFLRRRVGLRPHSDLMAEDGGPLNGCEVSTFRRGPLLYTAIHNSTRSPQRLHLRETTSGVLYESRRGLRIGDRGPAVVELPACEGTVLARLPYSVDGLTLTVPAKVTPGSWVSVRTDLKTSGRPVGDHVLAFRMTDPEGRSLLTSKWRAMTTGSSAVTEFFVPFNAAEGEWKVEVREAATGARASAVFLVKR